MTAVATSPAGVAVLAEGLVQIYSAGDGTEVVALRSVDLHLAASSRTALLGPSGSGKSTLLHLLAGLLRPTAGLLRIGAHDLAGMTPAQLRAFRGSEVGSLLQGAGRNLLPYLSARDNVRFARLGIGRSRRRSLPPAEELLDVVGVGSLAARQVAVLSGGEQQRVALAVAMAGLPALLLADEPTSQLGSDHRAGIVAALNAVNASYGTTLVVVTHDPDVAAGLGRTVTIRDGRVGSMGQDDEDFVVVARDGSIQLPAASRARWPAGTLLRADDDGDQLRLHGRDE